MKKRLLGLFSSFILILLILTSCAKPTATLSLSATSLMISCDFNVSNTSSRDKNISLDLYDSNNRVVQNKALTTTDTHAVFFDTLAGESYSVSLSYKNKELVKETITTPLKGFDTSSIKFEDKTIEYDGEPHSIEVIGAPEGTVITYENNNQANVGEYTVKANLSLDRYTPITLEAKLTITKKTPTITLDDIVAVEGKDYEITPVLENCDISDLKFEYYNGDTLIEKPSTAGNYTVKISVLETDTVSSLSVTVNLTIVVLTRNITLEPQSAYANGALKEYKFTTTENITISKTYTQDGVEVEPIKPGVYDVKLIFPANGEYKEETYYSTLTINKGTPKKPTADKLAFSYFYHDGIKLSEYTEDLASLNYTIIEDVDLVEGENKVKVKYNPDSELYKDSEIEITINILTRLQTPTLAFDYLTIKVTAVDLADKYDVYKNGEYVATLDETMIYKFETSDVLANTKFSVIAKSTEGLPDSLEAEYIPTVVDYSKFDELTKDGKVAYYFSDLKINFERLTQAKESYVYVQHDDLHFEVNMTKADNTLLNITGQKICVYGTLKNNLIDAKGEYYFVVDSNSTDVEEVLDITGTEISLEHVGRYVEVDDVFVDVAISGNDVTLKSGDIEYKLYLHQMYMSQTNINLFKNSNNLYHLNNIKGYVKSDGKIGVTSFEDLGLNPQFLVDTTIEELETTEVLFNSPKSHKELPTTGTEYTDVLINYSVPEKYSAYLSNNIVYVNNITEDTTLTITATLSINPETTLVLAPNPLTTNTYEIVMTIHILTPEEKVSNVLDLAEGLIEDYYSTLEDNPYLTPTIVGYSDIVLTYSVKEYTDVIDTEKKELILNKFTSSQNITIVITATLDDYTGPNTREKEVSIVYVELRYASYDIDSNDGHNTGSMMANYSFVESSVGADRYAKSNKYAYKYTASTENFLVYSPIYLKYEAKISVSFSFYQVSKIEDEANRPEVTAVIYTKNNSSDTGLTQVQTLSGKPNVTSSPSGANPVSTDVVVDAGKYVVVKFSYTKNSSNMGFLTASVSYDYDYNSSGKVEEYTKEEGVIFDNLQIHFLELGNANSGDCTYIKAGDKDILIDAGSRANSSSTIDNYVSNYVTDKKFEYVIATHGDQDHIAAFPNLLKTYSVENIIMNRYTSKTSDVYGNMITAFNNQVSTNSAVIHYADEYFAASASNVIDLGNDITMTILYNYYYFDNDNNGKGDTTDENDYSVVVLFSYKNIHYLFTGDLEANGEEKLAAYYDSSTDAKTLPHVALFKGGHHGSKTSSNECLLSLITPEICCVCCCAGSTEYTPNYNNIFPTQEFITRIAKYTDLVFVTTLYDENAKTFKSMNGNIIISSDGVKVAYDCTNKVEGVVVKLKDSTWFNETVYVDSKNNIVPNKGSTDFFTSSTEGVTGVPRRVWPS